MKRFVTAALALCLVGMGWLAQAAETVTLASLEWPPYTGEKLPDQGASSAVAKAAFEAMGYHLRIEFLPWSRAVRMARDNAKYAGYFPEYYSSQVAANFILSDPIGVGPLGLAQRADSGLQWNSVADLSKWHIGVVQDYVNTTEFDARVKDHKQLVDVSLNDSQNLLKLAARRVDLAIIDPYVFAYLSDHSSTIGAVAGQLEMNPKLLEYKNLYICFKRTPGGERLARVFNEGLKKIDVAAIMRKYIKDYRSVPGDKPLAKASTSGTLP